MGKRLLITGVAGMIGSHLADMALEKGYEVIGLDALIEGSNKKNIPDGLSDCVYYVRAEKLNIDALVDIDAIIGCAALSNVDTSIKDPRAFESNVTSTNNLAWIATRLKIPYIHISTDEVYGPYECRTWYDKGGYAEDTPFNPTSAYAASKAASELMALSYYKTFGVDIRVSRGANTYGTRQQDKLIPTIVKKVINGEPVPIFKTPAKREWLHVLDHCSAILTILEKGKAGEVYNVSSGESRSPLEILKLLAPQAPYELVEDRKGYDLEYKIDASKIKRELGWEPQHSVDKDLPEHFEWYKNAFETGYFEA